MIEQIKVGSARGAGTLLGGFPIVVSWDAHAGDANSGDRLAPPNDLDAALLVTSRPVPTPHFSKVKQ